jgi:predicted GIY-YIG superfamily endonuclease
MEGNQFLFSDVGSFKNNLPTPVNYQSSLSVSIENFTDHQPDELIPLDLMGLIDDRATPVAKRMTNTNHNFRPPETRSVSPSELRLLHLFLQKRAANHHETQVKRTEKNWRQYCLTRSRDSKALTSTTRGQGSTASMQRMGIPQVLRIIHQTMSATNLRGRVRLLSATATRFRHRYALLAMNVDLSQEAAQQAAILGGLDINVAQYVIDGAMSAPPVCGQYAERRLLSQ